MALDKLCEEVGFSADWLTATKFYFTSYCLATQLHRGIRQRRPIGGARTQWPDSQFLWAEGTPLTGGGITSAVDNGDGTLTFYDENVDGDSNPVANWIDGDGVKRWTGFSGIYNGVDIGGPTTCAPGSYKFAIFPVDDGTPPATSLADPNRGVEFEIIDNGENWVKVNDDGIPRLNGEVIGDYESCGYQIIRSGTPGGPTFGYSWCVDRYPPRPNDPEIDYGAITPFAEVTPSGSMDFTVTIGGTESGAIAYNASEAVAGAILFMSFGAAVSVSKSGSVYTVFILDGSDPAITASEASVARPTNKIYDKRTDYHFWKTPKSFPASYIGKDLICQVGTVWKRSTITAQTLNSVSFSSLSARPTGGYWIVEHGAWFRPRGRLDMVRRIGRRGPFWDAQTTDRWRPFSTWYGSNNTVTGYASHASADDTIATVGVQARTVHVDDGTGDGVDVPTFGVDARTEVQVAPEQLCTISDLMYAPRLFWSLYGIELGIEDLLPIANWVEPNKDYSGESSIPIWVDATWRRYAGQESRTPTITAISGEDNVTATITTIAMPEATPQAGAYSSLPCYWAIIDDDGDIKNHGTGTVTASELTTDPDSDGNPVYFHNHTTGDLDVDTGRGLVICFGWTRRYARRFLHLYPRTVWIPDLDDDGVPVSPPDEDHPGRWVKTNASTHYAEFDELGKIAEDGPAFVDGEAAAYGGDDYINPSTDTTIDDPIINFIDMAYQGLPNTILAGSTFPRWEIGQRSGQVTAAGSCYIEDSGKLWWVDATPLRTEEGTATGGSTTTILDATKLADPYWLDPDMGGKRFKGMILEVTYDGGTTWTPRPITDMTGAIGSITVAPALPADPTGKDYRIREPGGASRAVMNLWEDRHLEVDHAGSTTRVKLNFSDDKRAFFDDGALGFTPDVGEAWRIVQIEPGAVMQRKASDSDVNGWTLTDSPDADDDDRGESWLQEIQSGIDGCRRNLATIVKNYGRFRKRDMPILSLWQEMNKALDAFRWIRIPAGWTYNGVDDLEWAPDSDAGANRSPLTSATLAAAYISAKTESLAAWNSGILVPTSTLPDGFVPFMSSITTLHRDGDFGDPLSTLELHTDVNGNSAGYAKATDFPTNQLAFDCEFYTKAKCFTGNELAIDPDNGAHAEIFEAYGSGFAYNQFKSLGSSGESADKTTPRISPDTAGPDPIDGDMIWNLPVDPLAYDVGEDTDVNTGFKVSQTWAVLKFDGPNGVTYKNS